MKIAFPTNGEDLDSKMFFHFGRCDNYLIYDMENKTFEIIKNTSEHMGGKGLPPELIKRNKANIMIVSDLGQRALQLFSQLNIEVYCKAEGIIRDILKDFNEGELQKANREIICKGH
jgi:predicted Fe-Mo cluster-binding NifX family protein